MSSVFVSILIVYPYVIYKYSYKLVQNEVWKFY